MTAPVPVEPDPGEGDAAHAYCDARIDRADNATSKALDERDAARAEAADLRRRLAAVEALLIEPSPAKYSDNGNYEGRVAGTEHRTVGPHRAGCYQCREWCYPESYACPCCEPKIEPVDLRAALAVSE